MNIPPIARYPDAGVEQRSPAFAGLVPFNAGIERLATGMRWAEGPVWFGDGRYLLWSDIPNNRIMKWDEETNAVFVFRKPSNHANGNTRDRAGRLVTCEHGGRRVSRTHYDGTVSAIAETFQGKPLNSPNDVCVKSDGSVWFSDPTFGIRGPYEGAKALQELPTNLYCIDPDGSLHVAAGDIDQPNGVCFSPDETRLYVVESGARPRRIRVYDVGPGNALRNGCVFHQCEGEQAPDGFRCDTAGNLWAGWGGGGDEFDGVRIFAPSGETIGFIHLPERCANLCFGGAHRNRLFMASSQSIYALYLNAQGAPGG